MKKKLMIGLIAGTAVFAAVFGAAATLNGVSTGSLAAESTTVAACDPDGVDTSYAVSYGTGGYEVDSVTVSDIHANCVGETLSIQLTGAAGALTGGSQTLTSITGVSETLSLSTGPTAESVTGIHVAING